MPHPIRSGRPNGANRSEREKFRRRKVNLFRKADQLAGIADSQVSVLVTRNNLCYTYSSTGKDFLPPSFATKYQRMEHKVPQDYYPKTEEMDKQAPGSILAENDDDFWVMQPPLPGAGAPINEYEALAQNSTESMHLDHNDDSHAVSTLSCAYGQGAPTGDVQIQGETDCVSESIRYWNPTNASNILGNLFDRPFSLENEYCTGAELRDNCIDEVPPLQPERQHRNDEYERQIENPFRKPINRHQFP